MYIFDAYDLRARVSVVVILISPIILTLYLNLEVIRNLSTTIIIAVIVTALTNLLIVVCRKLGKKAFDKRDMVELYLYPNNQYIEKITKYRLYEYLAGKYTSFNVLVQERDLKDVSEDFKDACKSAINFLKEKNRGMALVDKENAIYGFCRNLYGAKNTGILLCVLLSIFHVGQVIYIADAVSVEIIVSIGATTIYLLLWIFTVKKDIVEFSARNYAEALIRSFDRISNE